MLCSKDFHNTTRFNLETKDQLWMSILADSHDIYCDCDTPFAHLLSNLFPPGHRDRKLTVDQILLRDYKQKCRSGGKEEDGHGLADTTIVAAAPGPEENAAEDLFQEGDVTELLNAVEDAEKR